MFLFSPFTQLVLATVREILGSASAFMEDIIGIILWKTSICLWNEFVPELKSFLSPWDFVSLRLGVSQPKVLQHYFPPEYEIE